MWNKNWRRQAWESIDQPWDIIIIGGGITGAGILREAARIGLKALLIEQKDFAWGTSSRSSKLVHGGFRYLKDGHIKLTLESVKERERLVRQGRGLVNPLGFLMPSYHGDGMPPWIIGLGLSLYDLLALKWSHRFYDAYDMSSFCPLLEERGLKGGYRFFDAQTDDARLVLRIIKEAVADGGVAINYARAVSLVRVGADRRVCGVVVEDCCAHDHMLGLDRQSDYYEVFAPIVINATGAWADDLRGESRKLRRLRGSHLIIPRQRLPLTRALSFWHPRDRRPVFMLPWDGITLVGTTDVDHLQPMECEPRIDQSEVDYLLECIHYIFPEIAVEKSDIQAVFSGIRPVVDTGKADPSKESREHVLWMENGLLTVTGGKLTTFRKMALQTLKKALPLLPSHRSMEANALVLDAPLSATQAPEILTGAERLRLVGRYGNEAQTLFGSSSNEEFKTIGESVSKWAEIRHAARHEAVVHLDDLLLRRVRIGLQLPYGGLDYMDQIREIAQEELGWDDRRWQKEVDRYKQIWFESYQLPERKSDKITRINEFRKVPSEEVLSL